VAPAWFRLGRSAVGRQLVLGVEFGEPGGEGAKVFDIRLGDVEFAAARGSDGQVRRGEAAVGCDEGGALELGPRDLPPPGGPDASGVDGHSRVPEEKQDGERDAGGEEYGEERHPDREPRAAAVEVPDDRKDRDAGQRQHDDQPAERQRPPNRKDHPAGTMELRVPGVDVLIPHHHVPIPSGRNCTDPCPTAR